MVESNVQSGHIPLIHRGPNPGGHVRRTAVSQTLGQVCMGCEASGSWVIPGT